MTFSNQRLNNAIKKLTGLPGIGPRQATRLAYFLARQDNQRTLELSQSISQLTSASICSNCFFIHENDFGPDGLCEICSDPARQSNLIAIIEKETDLISLEKTNQFNGHYLILGDLKKNGILEDEQRRRIEHLKKNINQNLNSQAQEIILAINPTSFGDFSASLLSKELAPFATKITRLGRGIPTGGEIEFADEDTLSAALQNRN